MPARTPLRPRERIAALAAVLVVQLGLGAALLSGFRVDVLRHNEIVARLIDFTIPPPPPKITPVPVHPSKRPMAAAPKAEAKKSIGGSPGPVPSHALPSVTPVVAIRPSAAPSGGGSGTGPATGAGSGGGAGGQGYGEGDGGTDLVQIAGEIGPSDYPRDLRERGIGGRVEMTFTVGTDGRVTSCRITRSSGVPELDALTCRLVQQRFRYRPSTDRYGRPIPDEVDGIQDWVASRG